MPELAQLQHKVPSSSGQVSLLVWFGSRIEYEYSGQLIRSHQIGGSIPLAHAPAQPMNIYRY